MADEHETVALRRLAGRLERDASTDVAPVVEEAAPREITKATPGEDTKADPMAVEETLPASMTDPRPPPVVSQPSETSLSLGGLSSGGVSLHPPRVTRRYGRFDLLLELAAGGMATLFLARLHGLESFEKLVALKIIHPHLTRDPKFVAMFKDEARLAALLHHPNAVQIFDLGLIEDTYFIAMEFVRGQDLRTVLHAVRRRLRSDGTWPPHYNWSLAARIVAEAAAGLHAAHELTSSAGDPLGLVHRDVSPHNLLVSYEGHVQLTDFGIAKAAHRSTHTDSGTVKGKLAYMSPEQALGEPLDRRADIFSLGVVLWEAICLKRLFRRKTDSATLHEVTNAEITRPRSIRPELPEELEDIVMRALARHPADRYDTARALQRDLEGLIAKSGVSAGSAEISMLMEDLFSEQRKSFEQDIKAALEGTLTPITPASPVDGTQETRLSAQVQRAPAPAGDRWTLKLGLAAALVVIGALVAFLLLREPSEAPREVHPPPPTAAMGTPPPVRTPPLRERTRRVTPPRPTPRTLLVTILVEPTSAEATIHFRGRAYRQNRLDLRVQPRPGPEKLRIEAPGHHPTQRWITIDPKAPLEHRLQLKPLPRRRTWRPRPMRPPPVGPVDIGLDD